MTTTAEMDSAAGTGSAGQPAGAVVVPVEAAAAPPAGAAARPAWTRVTARLTWARAAGAGALVVPVAVPAISQARPAWTRLSARLALVAALFLVGCAAAGLALFAMTLAPADSRLLGAACAPTDAEVAGRRTASEQLLLAASTQVLAATTGLLVPARPVAVFGCVLGFLTAYRATDVDPLDALCLPRHCLWRTRLPLRPLLYVVLCVALAVGIVVSIR